MTPSRTAVQTLPILLLLAALLLTAGCTAEAELEELKDEQARLRQTLKSVEKRLGALEKGGQPAAKVPARRVERKNPARAGGVEIGEAPVLGPRDAWVTIVEVSEFQ